MKPKPILAFITRHDLHPLIAKVLSGYEIIHIRNRALNTRHMVEMVETACYPGKPLVIAVIMPASWRIPFVQRCRRHFPTPGVTIVRPVMYGERWHGYFYSMKAPTEGFFAGALLERVWIPNGPNVDLAQRLAAKALERQANEPSPAALERDWNANRARHDEQAALLERLEELGEE